MNSPQSKSQATTIDIFPFSVAFVNFNYVFMSLNLSVV